MILNPKVLNLIKLMFNAFIILISHNISAALAAPKKPLVRPLSRYGGLSLSACSSSHRLTPLPNRRIDIAPLASSTPPPSKPASQSSRSSTDHHRMGDEDASTLYALKRSPCLASLADESSSSSSSALHPPTFSASPWPISKAPGYAPEAAPDITIGTPGASSASTIQINKPAAPAPTDMPAKKPPLSISIVPKAPSIHILPPSRNHHITHDVAYLRMILQLASKERSKITHNMRIDPKEHLMIQPISPHAAELCAQLEFYPSLDPLGAKRNFLEAQCRAFDNAIEVDQESLSEIMAIYIAECKEALKAGLPWPDYKPPKPSSTMYLSSLCLSIGSAITTLEKHKE